MDAYKSNVRTFRTATNVAYLKYLESIGYSTVLLKCDGYSDYRVELDDTFDCVTLLSESDNGILFLHNEIEKISVFELDDVFNLSDSFKEWVLDGQSEDDIIVYQCSHCGETVRRADLFQSPVSGGDRMICRACLEQIESQPVKQYSYKPSPKFYGKESDGLFCGAEIEINLKREFRIEENAMDITKVSDGFAYCKSDSSIGYGFEIVTHPFTRSAEIENGYVKKMFDRMNSTGRYKAGRKDNVTSCGVHIHVSRSYVSAECIKRIATFFTQNESLIKVLSHRTSMEQMDRYCSVRYLRDQGQIRSFDGDGHGSSHYSAIHVTPKTYEFRIFNSTTDYTEFMGYVEFVNLLVEYFKDNEKLNPADIFDIAKYMGYNSFVESNSGTVSSTKPPKERAEDSSSTRRPVEIPVPGVSDTGLQRLVNAYVEASLSQTSGRGIRGSVFPPFTDHVASSRGEQ